MKKIAIIIERADINLGGAERSVFELSKALSEHSFEVDILAAKGCADADNVHILCGDTPGRRVCYFRFAQSLKKYLAENSYAIVHSVLPFGFADVYQPRGGTFPESILRNVASYQNKFVESYKKITAFANFRRTMLLHAEKKLCKDSDGPVIAALSEYVAEQFRRHYSVSDERIVLIPNGVKTDKQIDMDETNRLRTQIFTELSLKESDRPVFFLFVANNFRLKGLQCLIRAMRLAADYDTDGRGRLIVVGSGKLRKYRMLAEKLDIQKKIVFSGLVPDVQNILSISDVAILPTFYDPSSRYILEAIAAGKPVITTTHNGATDLFVDNRHGRVIDCAENVTALAEAIGYFSNPEKIKTAAEKIVTDNLKEKISITRVAKQLESVYNSIIDKRRQ